jgi:hypothetical protein
MVDPEKVREDREGVQAGRAILRQDNCNDETSAVEDDLIARGKLTEKLADRPAPDDEHLNN